MALTSNPEFDKKIVQSDDKPASRGLHLRAPAGGMGPVQAWDSSCCSSHKAMGSEMLSSLVVKAQHQKHGLQSDIGRKQFGFGREDLDGGASYYEGEFKLFLRNGHGTLENTETGLKYVGQFEVDKFHGKGRHVWPDGSSYEGDWRNGRKQGQGTYISEENLKYTGPLPVSDVASSCHSCWVLVDGIQLSFTLWKAKVRSDVRQPAASPFELRAKSSSL
eukprot:s590_g7.t1